MNYTMVSQSRTSKSCIVCKMDLTVINTKVNKNQKYSKYREIVCNDCFNIYYP